MSVVLSVIWVLLSVSFVVLLVSLVVGSLQGKDTHKIGKALIGVFIGGAVFVIATFIYNFHYQFQWHEEEYDLNNKPYWSRVMEEPISDLIEVYYVRPLLGEGNYWYQTSWYESEDELAQAVCFDGDEEEIERFINIVDASNMITGDEDANPFEVPANNDREVEYYKINLEEFEFCPMQYILINYYIVVDQDTGETALAVYFRDT